MSLNRVQWIVALWVAALASTQPAEARRFDIVGPPGSERFGWAVATLPNGNIAITDPGFDSTVVNAGAIYLYGPDGRLLSRLVGSTAGDEVGTSITVLANGNFVVTSASWTNPAGGPRGAATWIDGSVGLNGTVSTTNSLIGDGSPEVVPLANGNYVLHNPLWSDGSVFQVGYVAWRPGNEGRPGAISAATALVGARNFDRVGRAVIGLPNGNFYVRSPDWDRGDIVDAGAFTWVDGSIGAVGPLGPHNSLVGRAAGDRVASNASGPLANSNVVISSQGWSNAGVAGVGAITWIDGRSGRIGEVSAANSMIGSSTNDGAGWFGLFRLSNGDVVACTPTWDSGSVVDAGAATLISGSRETIGTITQQNSLVGVQPNDNVCGNNVIALAGGAYLIHSPDWDDGAVIDAGAVTFGAANTGITGPVSRDNSVVGDRPGLQLGYTLSTALANGNFLVSAPTWPIAGIVLDRGLLRWGSGSTGANGPVSTVNSLVGPTGDNQGLGSPYALADGSYVMCRPRADGANGAGTGAVHRFPGDVPNTGVLLTAPLLSGDAPGASLCAGGVIPMGGSQFIVNSPSWTDDARANVGAVTPVDPTLTVIPPVSTLSMLGRSGDDFLGARYVDELTWSPGAYRAEDGTVLVHSSRFDDSAADVGAVSVFSRPFAGGYVVSRGNSIVGSIAGEGGDFRVLDDPANARVVVGRPAANRVSVMLREFVNADGFEP